jgi:hypothetical protein
MMTTQKGNRGGSPRPSMFDSVRIQTIDAPRRVNDVNLVSACRGSMAHAIPNDGDVKVSEAPRRSNEGMCQLFRLVARSTMYHRFIYVTRYDLLRHYQRAALRQIVCSQNHIQPHHPCSTLSIYIPQSLRPHSASSIQLT